MHERQRFVLDAEYTQCNFSELCHRYGISRKTGYKWLTRYAAVGLEGLRDRSHRPDRCPHATAPELVAAILELRARWGWGAPKLQERLRRQFPTLVIPTITTIHRVLVRHDRVPKRRRSRRRAHPGRPTTAITGPNVVWSADFKGEFKTGDGAYCYPLTVQDAYSRYLLACQAFTGPYQCDTQRVFHQLFQQYGLPERIRTDNGTPFASTALGRLSRLSVWWIQLGIVPELIEPAHPEQNGRHERMHRTLAAATARPPAPTRRAQQARFTAFREVYNTERPHEALGQRPPATCYAPSPRPYAGCPAPPTYPAHFEVRRVSRTGGIKWQQHRVPVSHVLCGLPVGLEAIADGTWNVFFGPVHLGWLDERDYRIHDHRGRTKRRGPP